MTGLNKKARVARTLAFLLLLSSPWVVLLATGPFWIGYWIQAEALAIGLWGLGATACVGLLLLPDAAGVRAVSHPLPLSALGLAGWTALCALGRPDGLLSLTGPPASGDGGASWAVTGLLMAHVIARRRDGLSLWPVLVSASLACGFCALPFVLGQGQAEWSPYWFPDYLAFPALFIGSAWLLSPGTSQTVPNGRGRQTCAGAKWLPATGLLLCAAVLVISGNNAAMLAVAACALLRLLNRHVPVLRPAPWMPLLALATVCVLVPVLIWMAGRGTLPLPGPVAESLQSRARLLELSAIALADRPWAWVTGFGWGSFDMLMLRHLLLDDVHILPVGDVVSGNWDAAFNNHFHSHNGFVQALLAVGLPGLALFGLMVAIPLVKPRSPSDAGLVTVAVLAMAALYGAWFQLPATYPAMAIGLGAAVSIRAGPTPGGRWLIAGRTGLVGFALMLAGLSALHWERAVETTQLRPAIRGEEPALTRALARDCATVLPSHGRGDTHLARLLIMLATDPESVLSQASTPPSTHAPALLAWFDCAGQRWLQDAGSGGLRLAIGMIALRNAIAFDERYSRSDPIVGALLDSWEGHVRDLIERLPERTDLAVPYLGWRLSTGNDPAVEALADSILAEVPRDPVGLWYSGAVLLADDDTREAGLSRMRRAVRNGLGRLIPLDPDLLETIGAERE